MRNIVNECMGRESVLVTYIFIMCLNQNKDLALSVVIAHVTIMSVLYARGSGTLLSEARRS
jgi:hypothetical protein